MKNKKTIPKEGCVFAGVRVVAFLAKGIGGLTLLGGIAGFISVFFRSAPDILSALQNLDHGFALFVLTLFATYFGIFTGLGCLGIIGIGLGFLLDFISVKSEEQHPIDKAPASI